MSVPYLTPRELAEITGDYEAAGLSASDLLGQHHGVMPFARQLGEKLDIAEKIERFTPIQTLPTPLNRHRWPADEWARMQRIANGEEE